MTTKRRFLGTALTACLAVAIALPAFAQQTAQSLSSESVIEQIKKNGVIKIGLSLFKPWSMRDKKGELIGFELDVGRKLAKDMGVDVEFVPTAWDGILPALLSRNFDVIISGMSVTPERNLTVNFSEPYAYSGLTILANTAMIKDFKLSDYNRPDVTFTARRGATSATTVTQLFPEAKLLLFDDDGAANQEVLNGNAHATMASVPDASAEIRKYGDVLSIPFNEQFLATGEAFAYRKGDPDATNFFNNWIGANWKNGWLQERNDFWFKGITWESEVVSE